MEGVLGFDLVIGYGNTLRGDDGVGRRVAEAVAAWNLPQVRVLSVHQLTPELAEPLARARCVIFADACVNGEEQVQVRHLEPAERSSALGHSNGPSELLALARQLYGRCPDTWLITIPAVCTDFGEELSETTERGINTALQHIARLLNPASPMLHR